VLHHNDIDVRQYCRGEIYALDPATKTWRSTRTGKAERPRESFATDKKITRNPAPFARKAMRCVLLQASPHRRLVKRELLSQVRAALFTNVSAVSAQSSPWWQRALGFFRRLWWPTRDAAWLSVRDSCDDDDAVYGVMGTYVHVLERVWAVIEHRDLLRARLREEIEEGFGMCFTGRVTRLFNALHGVVDGVHLGISDREALQARISRILAKLAERKLGSNENYVVKNLRADLSMALDECLPGVLMQGERDAWLDAFDDAANDAEEATSSPPSRKANPLEN
jgi:hypothetical protein